MAKNFIARRLIMTGCSLYKPFDVVADTKYNYSMMVDFSSPIGCSIFDTGIWEPNLSKFFINYIKPNMTCIDVGANMGWFTCLFSSIIGNNGKVLGFEPNPVVFRYLKNNVNLNGFNDICSLFNVAVSDNNGSGFFYRYNNSGQGYLDECFIDDSKLCLEEIIESDVVKLDNYFTSLNGLDVLKIDVQGGEFKVIKGCKALIRCFEPLVVFEFNGQKDCLDFFSAIGYSLFVLDSNGVLVELDVNNLKRWDIVIAMIN